MNRTLVIITTGGTIAMRHDPEKGGAVPAVTGKELIEAVPPLVNLGPVEVKEFANLPSPHMTPALMLRLARMVEEETSRPEVAGVVITHGTDTVEESAFFLDCFLSTDKPICFTAAMRDASALSPDGPANILAASLTAVSPEARGKGVLVVMNDTIHAAREVTKTHTGSVDTFVSLGWGPLGRVDEGEVMFLREALGRVTIRPEKPAMDVPLLRMVAGADSFLLNCLVDKGVDGIVLEGFGRGSVPPAVVPGIRRALEASIPMVLASRCPTGRVAGVYAYEGGVAEILKMGLIPAGEISGPKARLKLMLGLGLTRDPETLRQFFMP